MSEIFGAVKLKNKITIASSMAVFALVLATVIGVLTLATVDSHTHTYEYRLERAADGSFSLLGVCSVDNCESPFYIETDVDGVKLLTAESPTCSEEGSRVYTYSVDGRMVKYVEKIPMTAHTYNPTVQTQGEVTYITGKCTVEGCENPGLFVSNIKDYKLVDTIPGTCFSSRQDTYSYTIGGVEHTLVTLVEEDIPHTLNGVSVDSLKDADGNYAIGTPGIKLAGKTVACGETADGYYICEVCKQINGVKVVREGHKFVYNESNLTAPTLDATGLVTLVCHNPECSETVAVVLPKVEVGSTAFIVSEATEASPMVVSYSFESLEHGFTFTKEYKVGEKLYHNYECKLWLNEETGTFDVIGECHQPGCTEPEKCLEADVHAEFVKDTSTCLVPGIVIWKYEYEGETLYFDPPSMVTSDHSYAYNAENAIHPTLESGGIIEIYCVTEGCDHATPVNLPKVVIGDNAELFGPGPAGRLIYTYTYEYKENGRTLCTIKLDIFIGYEEN